MEERFTRQLRELGLASGDVVLMHSSMKALGTNRTPEAFIVDVLDAIGPEGTLLVPAFTYSNVTSEQPMFSATETEPCVGLIPRRFLRMEGVVRSLHPTHSVSAYGKHAQELISRHPLDETPVGPNSPVMRMLDYGGKILFIGDIVNTCTFMHGVEEIANAPYTLNKDRSHYIIKDADGAVTERDLFAHNFTGWGAEYQRLKDILIYPAIKTGKVGAADCFLVDAAALLSKALECFRNDPYCFVTDIRRYL